MDTHYIDLHCHPSLKPYSKSFKYTPTKQNELNAGRKNSIWHYSPPTFFEKLVNRIVTLTKFSQTDLTALAKANTQTVIVSLYPFEKHFLTKRVWGWKGLTDVLVNLAASISQRRIDHVLRHQDYFQDLMDEYQFYLQLDNQVQRINDIVYTYRVVRNFQEIVQNNDLATPHRRIINIVLTIEGGHAFNTGLKLDENTGVETMVLENVKKVKAWEHKPVFITFAHHFYNELCGHARSIGIKVLQKNQDRGLNTGITPLGHKVIDLLLDNTHGNRILIDIKHMSRLARKEFYNLMDTIYAGKDIPIIASHGGITAHRSIDTPNVTDYPDKTQWFNNTDINFYDDEIIRIAKSKGLLGIQLDERRIGSKKAIRKSKMIFPNKRKQLQKKALLVWRQVEYMGVLLNNEGLFCWGIQCIGSDFDGIVDPINGLWTAENIKDLGEELLNHAKAFLQDHAQTLESFNKITAETIVENFLRVNASNFLNENY